MSLITRSLLRCLNYGALRDGPINNGTANDMAKLGLGNKVRTGPMDGVISIITRDDYSSESGKTVLHSANMKISGYNEPRIFFSPRHHTTLEKIISLICGLLFFGSLILKSEDDKDYFLNYFNDDNSGKDQYNS